MKARGGSQHIAERRQRLLAGLAAYVPEMQRHALLLDRTGVLPVADIERLGHLGALTAPLPESLGGMGMGTEPDGALDLLEALCLIGEGSLSVGRLYEAHVNAIRLIVRYGTVEQLRIAADDVFENQLFALWVTDGPNTPLRLDESGLLQGGKFPCSGVGLATRAIVLATPPEREHRRGSQLLIVTPPLGDRLALGMHGMRATATGRVDFDGVALDGTAILGAPGDYEREPEFSAGAWRTSAVTLGGLKALITEMRCELVSRQRADDPHQRARVGAALIAQQTAAMWVRLATFHSEINTDDQRDTASIGHRARVATETASLDAIQLVQRSLGLSAFRRGSLAELLFRDLAMYLRQPASDEILGEAAGHFMQRDLPAMRL
jgi:alkylation response protein AidB-like acyl-CoA dehydrogenase